MTEATMKRGNVLSDEAKALLGQIDKLNGVVKELARVKAESHQNAGSRISNAMTELTKAAEGLRTLVGERVVADWTGTKVERKL